MAFCCSHPGLETKRRGALLRAVGAIWDCVGEMVTCICCVLLVRGVGNVMSFHRAPLWVRLLVRRYSYAGPTSASGSRRRSGIGWAWAVVPMEGYTKTPKGKRGRASRNLGVHGRDLAPSKPGVVPQTEEKLRKGCEKIKKEY